MTQRQRQFAELYAIDGNGTQAAIGAGYSAKAARGQGARLLAKADVRRHIEQTRAHIAEDNKLTAETVIDALRELSVNAEKESDRIRALELLGKYLALFTDRSQVSADIEVSSVDAPPRPASYSEWLAATGARAGAPEHGGAGDPAAAPDDPPGGVYPPPGIAGSDQIPPPHLLPKSRIDSLLDGN